MKNFKPSELPEDTVIEDLDDGGFWYKEESGVWGEYKEALANGEA